MLDIILLGLNHRTAPVEIREQIAFTSEETARALEALRDRSEIREVLLFSTCNRVEILMTAEYGEDAARAARNFIADFKGISEEYFNEALYTHKGDEASRHIFRVASSLDSMIVGEPQILGQIKEAYHIATEKKTTGVVLNRLLHKAFSVAKRVRHETGIGDHAVSVSYAAIGLGRKIFGSLEGKKTLLVGAGEMAELAVEHLISNHSGDILIANRTLERGVLLAKKFKGQAIGMAEIPDSLKNVDIIISSTGSSDYVITRDQVKRIMRSRKNRPLFFIDVAVPRDIDPNINKLNNAYVYDIDDLQNIIDDNIEERSREAVKGERIVDENVIGFRGWYENLDVVPTVVALREKMDSIAKGETEKTLQLLKHLSENDIHVITRMVDALVNKILHEPTVFLKSDGCRSDKSVYLGMTRKLFKLDE